MIRYQLFACNVDFLVTSEDLAAHAVQHGVKITSARVVADRQTGCSKGYGFLTVFTAGELENAVNALNGTELNGRPIVVRIADERGGR